MEKLSLNAWIHFLAIFFLFEIIVCRGIYFIVAYACHLSFQWRLHLLGWCSIYGCIGFIDGKSVKIYGPYKDPIYAYWINGMKIMYSINDPFVVDHNDIFINLDPGYSGSFHDVTILKYFELNVNWRCMFFHNDDYFEYILGDPGLQGRQIYIHANHPKFILSSFFHPSQNHFSSNLNHFDFI